MATQQTQTELYNLAQDFKCKMKQNRLPGSFDVAHSVVMQLRKVVGSTNWNNAKELMESIKCLGKALFEQTQNEVIGNMVKRVLKLVREEYYGAIGSNVEGIVI